jgi:putative NADH-flavin reductase
MPVIVVGADTEAGESIIDELSQPGREIRVFVSDPNRVDSYRARGLKVALGDVSDDSHVWGAATRCFSAVLIAEAAADNRERSFAGSSQAVLEGWADAVTRAGVRRVIWVASDEPPPTPGTETAVVSPDDPSLATRVAKLDDAQSIG